MSCNNFIPKGELTKYQVDPDAAVDLCFTLYSKDVFEQIFEITANGASSQEIAIDFKVVDSIEYLIFTNNDGGLTDKDIERLRKIGTPGNRGLSEYGVGVRANATAMSKKFINDNDLINEVSWFIADQKNIIETNIEYIDEKSFKIKKGHKMFLEEQEGCNFMRKYKSVIDKEGESTKIIVPFNTSQQEDYKGQQDEFKKTLIKRLKFIYNIKYSEEHYKVYFNGELINEEYKIWPDRVDVEIHTVKHNNKNSTLYRLDERCYINPHTHGHSFPSISEDEKDKLKFSFPNKTIQFNL
jgi:hypothetical protein